MNAIQMRDMFLYVSDIMIESEGILTEIDNKIGDGDHGIGMAIGFKGIKNELKNKEFIYVNEVFHSIGMTMLCVMGGASGVLFGTVFVSGIVEYPQKKEFKLEDFANVLAKSLALLKKRGKAKVGDKTMVDALEPAVLALKKSVKSGLNIKEGFVLAASEAKRGMEYTKECRASFGRAKYYGEKAIGIQDAGATSVYIIFNAMSDWISKNI
ncbi:MAG: dihydroxyacetone kinase subunit L [Clostridia bacterium]|nr:dihydroxyacetone kinase subunit L [Clostridia bacterium]